MTSSDGAGSVLGLPLWLVCLVMAPAVLGHGQVRVDIQLSGEDYLKGEPVRVVLQVNNIGADPLAHSKWADKIELVIPGQQVRQNPWLGGCYFGRGSGGSLVGSTARPPQLEPGQTITLQRILEGYRLEPGEYTLVVSGEVGVRWPYPEMVPPQTQPPTPKHKVTDPVEGRLFNQLLRLVIREGSEAELRQRFNPYVEWARTASDSEVQRIARESIAEMGPPFLREVILEFPNNLYDLPLIVKGLRRINNDESRADLIALYDKNTDPTTRRQIVEALAGIATPKESRFLAGLLSSRIAAQDEGIRYMAAVGVGRIGGANAVKALADASQKMEPAGRHVVAKALGITRDASAVPVLIRLYEDGDNVTRDSVCGALQTLTHYQWCDGSGNVPRQVATWKRWWQRNAANVRIYGTDACPEPGAQLPMLR